MLGVFALGFRNEAIHKSFPLLPRAGLYRKEALGHASRKIKQSQAKVYQMPCGYIESILANLYRQGDMTASTAGRVLGPLHWERRVSM